MSATTLANIIYNNKDFKGYLAGRFTSQMALLSSGILGRASDALIPIAGNEKGTVVSFASWNVLSGEMDTIQTGVANDVNNLSQFENIGRWLEREKTFGAESIIGVVSGADPMAAVADMIIEYVSREIVGSATALLSGCYATALASTHVADRSAAKISEDAIIAAKLKLGDNGRRLTNMICNSKVSYDLDLLKITKYDDASRSAFTEGSAKRVLGLDVAEDDRYTASSGVYSSYIGAKNSMVYQLRNRPVSTLSDAMMINIGGIQLEMSRDALTGGGVDRLTVRLSYLTHLNGMQWSGSTAATSPTNAQLATGSNWTKAASDDKLISMVQLKTL